MTFARLAFFPGGTVEHYRALETAIGPVPRPDGRLVFAAGPAPGGWQVVQIWRSKDELDAFNAAVFLPAVARLGGTGFPRPPVVTDWEPAELELSPGPREASTS
ncbi:hypothetical protein GC722_07155 [Auraticoccus sp. F435]|uniref:ABM domain-containing protein n=1 Tax=Auraticoccus cholistanensis TaxID=2656650 RepID=A0A6A9V0L0_9ACTN|nr:hypothetical protein [Auraticoccus cholistanensis]MVA75799.1 hypothetical protein [Auraticoccus cholistanensis]